MNEYAARSMLFDISQGQRIVIVERDYRDVRQAVDVFAAEHARNGWGVTVRRTNGAEAVTKNDGGGWIRFATPLSDRMRGLSADVVFIDNDAHRVLYGDGFARMDRFRQDIARVLVTTGGRVVNS